LVRVRRFNNQPYRLFSVSRFIDRKGNLINPEIARKDARSKAEYLRTRGYNARVVDWVAGSGVFIGRRRYDKTKSEARYDWLDRAKDDRFEQAAFGFGISGFSTVPTLKVGDDPRDPKWNMNIVQGQRGDGKSTPGGLLMDLDWNRLDGMIDDLGNWGFNLPSTSKNAGAVIANELAVGYDKASQIGMNAVESPNTTPGWGIGSVSVEEGQRFGELSDARRRFHVVASFNDGNDNWGEIPMYAFATQSQAKRFLEALQEEVNSKGFLYLPGTQKFAEGTYNVVNTGSEIPIDRLELAIVPEYADLAVEAENQNRKDEMAQGGLNLNSERENMLPMNPSLQDVMREARIRSGDASDEDMEIQTMRRAIGGEDPMEEMIGGVQCPYGGLGCWCPECVGVERITARCNACFGFDRCLCE
jgi:RNA polymerase-binding transcription factor DksA